MPAYLRLRDIDLFFTRACCSKRGSASTKLGELVDCWNCIRYNETVIA